MAQAIPSVIDGRVWEGDIPSSSDTGAQTVFAMVEDADHKIATHIGIYETRRVGPDFGLEVFNTPQTVLPGGSAQFVIRVAQVSGASPRVTLAVEGLPPGASGSFSQNPITPIAEGGVTTLTIDTLPSLAVGSYQLTIVGTGGALRKHRASVTLNVEAAAADFVLLSSVSQVVLTTGCDDWIESPAECPVSSADFEIT
jgi:hypothetical protein